MSNWLQEFFQYKAVVEANLNVTSAATVQQYFKYTYKNTVYIQGTSGTYPAAGFIHFNNADTTLATQAAMANLTSGAQGIGSYISEQNAGVHMHVRSTQTNSLGIYKIQSLPVTSTAHRYFTVSVINGIALQDGDELTVTFSSVANCIWDDTNDTITANGVAVAPNVLAVDTIADALSTVTVNATNHRKEFAVLDPGGNTANALLLPIPWNVMVDNTMGILRQMNGLSDFAMLKTAGRYCQPAANASGTPTVDATVSAGRTRVTVTAHGLTALVAGTDTYLVNQTAQNGWTANERVKILTIVDANTLVLDKAFSTLTGALLPDFYLITETMPIETILCPPLRTWSQLQFWLSLQMATSANAKTISFNWGGTAYYAPSAFTATKGVGRWIAIKNIGATDKQIGHALTSSNTGLDGTQTAGNVPTSAVQSNVATTANLNVAIANAADWVEVENLVASARW
jgi:hypothetical protein